MKRPVTFTVEEKLIEQLRELSKKTGRPQAYYVGIALEKVLKEHKELLK